MITNAQPHGKQVFLLDSDVAQKILAELADLKEAVRKLEPVDDAPITHEEAAAFLGITRNTLTERIKAGYYPAAIVHVDGARRKYFKSELKALLKRK